MYFKLSFEYVNIVFVSLFLCLGPVVEFEEEEDEVERYIVDHPLDVSPQEPSPGEKSADTVVVESNKEAVADESDTNNNEGELTRMTFNNLNTPPL